MKRRNYLVKALTITISVLTFFLTINIFFAPFLKDPDLLTVIFEVLWCIFNWAITLLNFFAMRHIHHSQKPLEGIGIYANGCIMRLYLILFSGLALVYTANTISTLQNVTQDHCSRNNIF